MLKRGDTQKKKHGHTHNGEVHVVLEMLKTRGHKVTRVRKMIIDAIQHAGQPLSIRDLALHVSADEASVYRTVNLLHQEDLVEAIPLGNESFVYALKTGHHHHLVCVSCNLVTHIECDAKPRLHQRHTPFAKILSHEVTYYGVCQRCEGSRV